MNTKFGIIFVALIFIQTVSGRSWALSCGENEIYVRCSRRASRCEKSCEEPDACYCNYLCGNGCDCDEGFLRNKDGRCVLPNEC